MGFKKPECYKDIHFSDFSKETQVAIEETIGDVNEISDEDK